MKTKEQRGEDPNLREGYLALDEPLGKFKTGVIYVYYHVIGRIAFVRRTRDAKNAQLVPKDWVFAKVEDAKTYLAKKTPLTWIVVMRNSHINYGEIEFSIIRGHHRHTNEWIYYTSGYHSKTVVLNAKGEPLKSVKESLSFASHSEAVDYVKRRAAVALEQQEKSLKKLQAAIARMKRAHITKKEET